MIGALSERITIERETPTPDGAGGFTSIWATLATRWAQARPVRGRETNESGQTIVTNTFLFIVRKDSITKTITGGDRAVWDGSTYNILSTRPGKPNGSDMRAWMTIEAETELGA